MKIQLERKLQSCPDTLTCAVCRQPFPVRSIRTLLFTNQGFLQGDICPDCLKLGAEGIRETLRERAILLKRQSEFNPVATIAIHELAVELMAWANEEVEFPSLLQWWLKRWEIFTQESEELESARWGLSSYPRRKRSPRNSLFRGEEK